MIALLRPMRRVVPGSLVRPTLSMPYGTDLYADALENALAQHP